MIPLAPSPWFGASETTIAIELLRECSPSSGGKEDQRSVRHGCFQTHWQTSRKVLEIIVLIAHTCIMNMGHRPQIASRWQQHLSSTFCSLWVKCESPPNWTMPRYAKICQDADDDQNEEGQCLIRAKSVVLDGGMMATVPPVLCETTRMVTVMFRNWHQLGNEMREDKLPSWEVLQMPSEWTWFKPPANTQMRQFIRSKS